jgi:pimeloyl-ACP methyl ester carboxylesterase
MSLGSWVDARLHAAAARAQQDRALPPGQRWVATPSGRVRLLDTGGTGPAVLMAPDGPCVIEHYAELVTRLSPSVRLLIADLPGFGHSLPTARHDHRLRTGAEVLLALIEALNLSRVTLALSCVNGFYGIAAAHLAPQKITGLVLAQTPGLSAMRDWTDRIVPRPIRWPGIGQWINFTRRRRVAHDWYKVALARREDRPAFQQTADAALSDGGCYCFAGVVQGMSACRDDEPLLQPLAIPATLLWGRADRSHKPTDPGSLRAHLPQLQLIELDGVGHFPDLESPTRYAEALLSAPDALR